MPIKRRSKKSDDSKEAPPEEPAAPPPPVEEPPPEPAHAEPEPPADGSASGSADEGESIGEMPSKDYAASGKPRKSRNWMKLKVGTRMLKMQKSVLFADAEPVVCPKGFRLQKFDAPEKICKRDEFFFGGGGYMCARCGVFSGNLSSKVVHWSIQSDFALCPQCAVELRDVQDQERKLKILQEKFYRGLIPPPAEKPPALVELKTKTSEILLSQVDDPWVERDMERTAALRARRREEAAAKSSKDVSQMKRGSKTVVPPE